MGSETLLRELAEKVRDGTACICGGKLAGLARSLGVDCWHCEAVAALASTPPATPGDAAGDDEPPACTCDNGSGGCDRSRWFAARNEAYEICSRTAPGAGTAGRSIAELAETMHIQAIGDNPGKTRLRRICTCGYRGPWRCLTGDADADLCPSAAAGTAGER